MGDPPPRRRSLVLAFLAAILVVALNCSADAAVLKEKVVAVVGAGECADCASKNIKDVDVLEGLHVAINCKAGEGEYQIRGVGKLDKGGKFTVQLPSELLKEDGQLKSECYAQLVGGSKNAPCPNAHGPEAAKLVLKSRDGDKHTFGTAGKLGFSSETCAAAFLWHHPWFKPYPYTPKVVYFPPKVVYFPPKVYPPIYKPPVYQPPPTPVYTPPVYQPPPVYSPPPVYKPPPVYSPPPVYNPPPVYSPPPVYTPPTPVYHPPPVYKPPPVYVPPVYKPPCPPVYIYKPPLPPVYTKPWPPIPPVYVYKKPWPPLPPKYFYPHPKFGYPPSYGWPPMSPYTKTKHPIFPPAKGGQTQAKP